MFILYVYNEIIFKLKKYIIFPITQYCQYFYYTNLNKDKIDILSKEMNKNSLSHSHSQYFKVSYDTDQTEQNIISEFIDDKDTVLNDYCYENFSLIYLKLLKIIPKHSKSIEYLNELIKNHIHNTNSCCDPNCKKKIISPCFCAFDGRYCSDNCRANATYYMSSYWNKI